MQSAVSGAGGRNGYGLPHPLVLCALTLAMLGMTLGNVLGAPPEPIVAARAATAAEPDPQQRARLIRVVRNECGSCHGLTLKGGLGPPLLPAALAGRPASYLQTVILAGRTGTAMPPWSQLLSVAEADWIAAQLLAGFPDAP